MSQEECPRTLSLTPKAVSRLAGESAVVFDAQAMLDRSSSWTEAGSRRDGLQITSTRLIDNGKYVTWFCRKSQHRREETTFDDIWMDLEERRFGTAPIQRGSGSRLQEATQLRYISESESVWSTLRSYPSPMSPRIFTDHVVTQLNSFPSRRRSGLRISTPVNLGEVEGAIEVEGRGKRARHVRIEQVQELDDTYIEWKVLLCEDIGGTFANWCKNRRTKLMLTRDYQASIINLKLQRDGKAGREGAQEGG